MEREGVWLGAARGPIRIAMIISLAFAAIMCVWMIIDSSVGMDQMLRPEGRLSIRLTLWAIIAALFFTSVYLSDNMGVIEVEPTGFVDWISLIASRLSMISIVLVVIVMFYEVVARYVFEKPTLWANELSLWIAGFLFLLAGLYAMQQRSHIRIYIIYDLMPRWMQKTADVLSVMLIWVFAISLIWGGYNEARDKLLRMEAFGTAWDPPIPATIKPAILIIITLVAIQALSNLIRDWNKAPEHHSPADEIDEHEIEIIRKTLEDK